MFLVRLAAAAPFGRRSARLYPSQRGAAPAIQPRPQESVDVEPPAWVNIRATAALALAL